MKPGLTFRIVLHHVLLAAVLLTVVGVLCYRIGSRSLTNAVSAEMLAKAIEKEAAMNFWFEERMAELEQTARQPGLVEKAAALAAAAPGTEAARTARDAVLRDIQPYLTGPRAACVEVFVLETARGKVIASTSPHNEGKIKHGERYFLEGLKGPNLQEPYFSDHFRLPLMVACLPLRTPDGRLVALLAARLDLASIRAIVSRRTGLCRTEDAFLINSSQYVVTQPRFLAEPAEMRRKLDTEAARRCAARDSGVIQFHDYRGVPVIAAFRWNARFRLGLIVKVDQAEALAPVRALGRWVILVSALSLAAAAGLAWCVASTITRPLQRLHGQVMRFAGDDRADAGEKSRGDEVELLAREFHRMAGRVAERNAGLAQANETLLKENLRRRRTEENLRVQTGALDAAANAIVITDRNGKILSVNPAFTTLTGYSAAEAVGQTPRILNSGKQDREFYAHLWRTITSGLAWHGILTNRRKDGSHYEEEMTITPLRNPRGVIIRYVAIKQDVTARRQAEEKINSQLQELLRWQDVMLDREGRVQQLKHEVNALCRRLGEPVAYPSQESAGLAEIEPAEPEPAEAKP